MFFLLNVVNKTMLVRVEFHLVICLKIYDINDYFGFDSLKI